MKNFKSFRQENIIKNGKNGKKRGKPVKKLKKWGEIGEIWVKRGK